MDANLEEKPEKLSLYDRLGGATFISLAVEKFCDRMRADPQLRDLFADVPLDLLKKQMAFYATELFKNPGADPGVLFNNLPSPFPLSETQFNRGVSHLIASLVWIGLSRELIEEVLDKVTPLSAYLVSPANPDLMQTDSN